MSWAYVITDQPGALSWTDQQNNMEEFAQYFSGYMTAEAMAGIMGNMMQESGLNPGQQELYHGGSLSYGYGLIQWTPGRVIVDWCDQMLLDWYDGDSQCYRIKCEGERTNNAGGTWLNGYLQGVYYHYTWQEFCNLTDYNEACKAYLAQRERASASALNQRLYYAQQVYDYITGATPTPPPPTPPTPPDPPTPIIDEYTFGGIRDLQRRGIITNGRL